MTKERKIYIILIIGYFMSMLLPWFGNDMAIDGMRGIGFLAENPAVLAGAALMVIGALKKDGRLFVLAGAALAFAGEIFSFIRWYAPAVEFDIAYSFQTAFTGFYVSVVMLAVIGAAVILQQKRNRSVK